MKTLILTAIICLGLSTGCAQIEYLQNPANYRVNPLSGKRMYCHGDSRDNYTPCEGWQSPAQIAAQVEQAKVAEENARIAAKNQAIADAKQAAIDKIANDKAAKLQAIEDKKQAIESAKAARELDRLDAERGREVVKHFKEAARLSKIAHDKEQSAVAAMNPVERAQWQAQRDADNAMQAKFDRAQQRNEAERQYRSAMGAAQQRANQDRNMYCKRMKLGC